MKIFLAHNYYQQPGGEDQIFAEEAALLRKHGHEVIEYTVHNDAIDDMASWEVAQATLWNQTTYREVADVLRREEPDVAHFNNTFPLLSPSVYYAARKQDIPVLQTLYNFRLLCVNGLFFRDGRVCEDCLGGMGPLPGIAHGCYRSSRLASAGVASLQVTHRLAGTWSRAVDLYIAMSSFSREKFIEGGLPAEKIALKPSFLVDPPPPGSGDGNYAVFVGRLSSEKGVNVLLEAWKQLGDRIPLHVVGDGPLIDDVRDAAATSNVKVLGWTPHDEVQRIIGAATMLVFPSECYETFGRVGMEGFAGGTPVIASDLGAMQALVDHGRTGRLFRPGDVDDLVRQVTWALDHPREWTRMRATARTEFEENYTGERNYAMLLDIYHRAQRIAGAVHSSPTLDSQYRE